MSTRTNKYQFQVYQEGDFTSAGPEMQRWETLDSQLFALFNIIGNGVISGWDIIQYSGLSVTVTPGKGHVAFVAVESKENTVLSLTPNTTNYIYAVLDNTSYWTKKINFVAYLSTTTNQNTLFLGQVTTDSDGIVGEIVTSGRTELGFVALIQNIISSHKHIGGTDNPSPIDLSSQVQGLLGIDNIPFLDASKIQTGTIDSDRIPLIDHTTKLTGVGSLTHSQIDSFVEQFSIEGQKLMGEVSTTNLLQLILATKHVYPDIDEFLVNEIAFIPGISPDSYIDTVNTTAIVDTRTHAEGGQHTITGTPSAAAKAYIKIWDTEDDFINSTNNNVFITGDSVSISVKENTLVIDEFNDISGWSLSTQNNSVIPYSISLDATTYVIPPSSGKLSVDSESIEAILLANKDFDSQDWSAYKFIKFYIKTESVEHGDLFFYVKDSTYGAQNSYTKVLDRNAPTIDIDTMENGWQEITIDISSYNRSNINGIGFYVSTKDGWDTSKGFDLNIDDITLTSGNIYEDDGYIRFIFGNDYLYRFWRVRWDAFVPSDLESEGVSLQSRVRVSNTVEGLSLASWTPYSTISGYEIPIEGTYKYIELEFYFTASESKTRSMILKKSYLDFYVSDIDNSFEFTTKEDWDSGTLFNIDTEAVPGSMIVSNINDINTFYYGSSGSAYQLDSDLKELYNVIGSALPISTYQAINSVPPSFGLITGVSRGNNGNLWLSDTDNDRIIEIDKSGNLIRGFYGSFLAQPLDLYGIEDDGPGSNVIETTNTTTTSTSTSTATITKLEVLHSIYNPNEGTLYIVFNSDLENIYSADTSFDINRIYIKVGSHKIHLNDSKSELLGVNEEKYNLWKSVSNVTSSTSSTHTTFLNQFNFQSHVLKITVEGSDRSFLDYLLNQDAPSVIIASPLESQKVSSSVTINMLTNYVDLSIDSLRVTLDGTNIQTINEKTISYSGLSNGRHTMKVEVLDQYLSVYPNIEATANMTFIVEQAYALPIVYFTSPKANQLFSNNPIQIDFKVDSFPIIPSGQHIKYVLDDEESIDHTTTDPIILDNVLNGKHTLNIYTVDQNGDILFYPYGDSSLEFIVGVNSNASAKLYVETQAVKDITRTHATDKQIINLDIGNITFSNIYAPIDIQVIPEDDNQSGVTVMVAKMRSPSWTYGLAGIENTTEIANRIAKFVEESSNTVSTITLNESLSSVLDDQLIYGTKFLDGHSVTQLDLNGNVVFSNNAAIFANSKEEAKDLLGSVEKIGLNEVLIADSVNKRAMVIYTDLTTQIPVIEWQYDSDRYIPDFHLVNQDDILISVTDGNISDIELYARIGSTVIWQNDSSSPISIYSGYTTYDEFTSDPDLALYGNDFKSGTLQPGERYTFKFTSNNTYNWFVYPSILTAKVIVTTQRISDRDQFIVLENDGLESPFSSRVIRVDSWGNVAWAFGEGYLVKPRDARPLLNGVLIST